MRRRTTTVSFPGYLYCKPLHLLTTLDRAYPMAKRIGDHACCFCPQSVGIQTSDRRAVARLPEARYALEHTQMIIAHGSTNVFVAEEVLGYCPERDKYVSGHVINGTLCQTESAEKPPILRLVKGQPVPPVPTMEETLAGWGDTCVFIKGSNAVDPEFNAAVFNAHASAGTIGFAYGKICGMGIPLIVPIGLEKLIPSVKEASNQLGHARVDYFNGQRIGMLPLINAKVITEIQAFDILLRPAGGPCGRRRRVRRRGNGRTVGERQRHGREKGDRRVRVDQRRTGVRAAKGPLRNLPAVDPCPAGRRRLASYRRDANDMYLQRHA